mgnify:CR=1 FL=1
MKLSICLMVWAAETKVRRYISCRHILFGLKCNLDEAWIIFRPTKELDSSLCLKDCDQWICLEKCIAVTWNVSTIQVTGVTALLYSTGYITFGRALDFNATGEQFDQCRVAKDSLFFSFYCPLILAYWNFWSSLIALAELRKGKINVDSVLVFYSKSNSGFACRLPELFYATYPHWCSYWSAYCFQSEAVVINSPQKVAGVCCQ